MKNNTKIRLHLSKQLFESLTKQVIAESKKNFGPGMTEVKAKKAKASKKEDIKETAGMVDENMLSDLMDKLKTLPADKLKQLKAFWDNELSPEAVRSGKVKSVTLPSNIEEMETIVSEGVDPEFLQALIQSVGIIATIIGGGIVGVKKYVTSIAKKAMTANPEKFQGLDVNNPEDVKKVADEIGRGITGAMQKSAGGTGGAGIGGQSDRA